MCLPWDCVAEVHVSRMNGDSDMRYNSIRAQKAKVSCVIFAAVSWHVGQCTPITLSVDTVNYQLLCYLWVFLT